MAISLKFRHNRLQECSTPKGWKDDGGRVRMIKKIGCESQSLEVIQYLITENDYIMALEIRDLKGGFGSNEKSFASEPNSTP